MNNAFAIALFFAISILFPVAVSAVLRSDKLRLPGRIAGFLLLFVAARYGFAFAWQPQAMSGIIVKSIACGISMYWVYFVFCISGRRIPSLVLFACWMMLPFLFRLAAPGGNYYGFALSELPGIPYFWCLWTAYFYILLSCTWLVKMKAKEERFSNFDGETGRFRFFHSWRMDASLSLWTIFCVALIVVFACADLRARAAAGAMSLSDVLRARIAERWPSISRHADEVVGIWDEIIEKDRRLMAKNRPETGRAEAYAKMTRHLDRLREEILPEDSRKLFASLTFAEVRVSIARKRLRAAEDARLSHPGEAEKFDRRVAKRQAALDKALAERDRLSASLAAQLREIGALADDQDAGSALLLTANLGDLLDNVIVAHNIAAILGNLESLQKDGGVSAAKRYHGVCMVLLDVQSECYREYLAKSESGVWNKGVEGTLKDAEAAQARNLAKAEEPGLPESERAVFLHNAEVNARTIRAATAYLDILARHEAAIRERLEAAGRMRDVERSTYEAICLNGGLIRETRSEKADFAALLELRIPTLSLFDDSAIQEEFDAIAQKFMKE